MARPGFPVARRQLRLGSYFYRTVQYCNSSVQYSTVLYYTASLWYFAQAGASVVQCCTAAVPVPACQHSATQASGWQCDIPF
jgi:hypothetical protein